MQVTVRGLILRERSIGDNDKYLDVFTHEKGLIEILARGVKKKTSKYLSVCQPYSYAEFSLYESEKADKKYILNSADSIRNFFRISQDVEKYALACYFSELMLHVAAPEQPNNEALRLILNCLHFLEQGTLDNRQLKATFELRLMTEIGLTPYLVGCCKCYKYKAPAMQFDMRGGRLFCEDCVGDRNLREMVQVDMKMLHYLRTISLMDMKYIFGLRVDKMYMRNLCEITEEYLKIQLNAESNKFNTLDYFNTISGWKNKYE